MWRMREGVRDWLLLVGLLALNTADLLTSYYAVRVKGATELNPIARALVSGEGWLWAYVYKAAIPLAIIVLYVVYGPERPDLRRVAKVLLLYLAYIVANNLVLLLLP
jgi:nucleoside-diphosphate-sugar epimerase